MNISRIQLPLVLQLLLFLNLSLPADVIYLNDGSILVVEKAWLEGDQVNYQTSSGLKSLPKSQVRKIQAQKAAATAPPETRRYGIAVESPLVADGPGRKVSLGISPKVETEEISEEIVDRLRANLKADPQDVRSRSELVSALNSLGALQYLRGDYAGAKFRIRQALVLEPKNPRILVNAGLVHYQSGEYREAEEVLLTATQLEPNNQEARYLLAEAFYAQDKIAMAITAWKETLQLGPFPVASSRLKKAEEEAGIHSQLGALSSAHFILRYDREVSDYRLGQEILYALERNYRRLNLDLVSNPPATVTVIVYPTRAYFDVTRAPRWSGGLYDGKIRLPTKGLTSVTPDIEGVLVHELTHSFIAALAGNHFPSWLNEGIAQFEEGKTAWPQSGMLT